MHIEPCSQQRAQPAAAAGAGLSAGQWWAKSRAGLSSVSSPQGCQLTLGSLFHCHIRVPGSGGGHAGCQVAGVLPLHAANDGQPTWAGGTALPARSAEGNPGGV